MNEERTTDEEKMKIIEGNREHYRVTHTHTHTHYAGLSRKGWPHSSDQQLVLTATTSACGARFFVVTFECRSLTNKYAKLSTAALEAVILL